MSCIHTEFFMAKTLTRGFDIQVILPEPGEGRVNAQGRYPVLWLLHGEGANHTSWTRFTSLERYLRDAGIACVLPCGDLSYYANIDGGRYFDFVTQELRMFCTRMFPISNKREDNFIAGASMGAYAALRIGLMEPERYCAVGALSGANITNRQLHPVKGGNRAPLNLWRGLVFGTTDAGGLRGGEFDLYVLAKSAREQNRLLPRIYGFCGADDAVLPEMQRDMLELRGSDADYSLQIVGGGHDFACWDACLPELLRQLAADGMPAKVGLGTADA